MPSLKTVSSKTRQQQTNHGSRQQQPGLQQLPPVPWNIAASGPGVARAAPSGVAAAVSEVSAAVEELHAQLEVSSVIWWCCPARHFLFPAAACVASGNSN